MAKKMKLSGCPFCGGKAFWRKGDKQTRMTDCVQCYECLAELEGDYTPMSALEKWNIRTAGYIVHENDRDVTIEGENL